MRMHTVLRRFQRQNRCRWNHTIVGRSPRLMVWASGCQTLLLRRVSISSSKNKQWSQLSKPSRVSSLTGAAASVSKHSRPSRPSRFNQFNRLSILGRNPTNPYKQHRKLPLPLRICRLMHVPLRQLAQDNVFARAMLWTSELGCSPFAILVTLPSCIKTSPKLAKEHRVAYSPHTTPHMVVLLSSR